MRQQGFSFEKLSVIVPMDLKFLKAKTMSSSGRTQSRLCRKKGMASSVTIWKIIKTNDLEDIGCFVVWEDWKFVHHFNSAFRIEHAETIVHYYLLLNGAPGLRESAWRVYCDCPREGKHEGLQSAMAACKPMWVRSARRRSVCIDGAICRIEL